jgi:ECF transporter S component (folate family)
MNNQRIAIRQIAFGALLVALSIVLTRIVGIPLGFFRITLGAMPIFMSSLMLGPVAGLIVGAAADTIGFLIFPPGTWAPWPLLASLAQGFIPYFLFKATMRMRYNKKPTFPFIYPLVGGVWAFISTFVIFNDVLEITGSGIVISFTLMHKIFIPLVSALLLGGLLYVLYLINKKLMENKHFSPNCPTPYQVAFVIFIVDLLVEVLYPVIWKQIQWSLDPMVTFFIQTAIFLVLVPIKTFFTAYIFIVYHRLIEND